MLPATRQLSTLLCIGLLSTLTHGHIGYNGRNFGTLNLDGSVQSINTQTVGGSFGWADGTTDDWADSHRLRPFRFTLDSTATVTITAQRNNGGTGPADTFLPGFTLFSGLGQRAQGEGVMQGETFRTEGAAHDSSPITVDYLVGLFGSDNGSGLGGSGKKGAFRSLDSFTIGNSPTYVTAGDPLSGVLIDARLVEFVYIGHAADGTSANFGSAPGINGDGNADGFVTWTFHDLAPGHYSLFVGGANLAGVANESSPWPTFGFDLSVAAVPEPGTVGLLVLGLGLLKLLRRKSLQ